MIRRLIRWLTLVPLRKVTVYLINGAIRRGRVWHVGITAVTFRLSQECSETFLQPTRAGACCALAPRRRNLVGSWA